MMIRVALLGGDELVRRGLDGMLRTLGGFELATVKDRERAPIDIALVETFGTSPDDTPLARAVVDPFIRRVAVFTWNHHPGLVHLVSTVSGRLREGVGWRQTIEAVSLDEALRRADFVSLHVPLTMPGTAAAAPTPARRCRNPAASLGHRPAKGHAG